MLGRTGVGGGAHGHGSRRGERRGGLGACRALVAPGKSGFVKQGALGAGLARVRPSGRDRWPRRRTAPPWARCRKTEVEETVSGNFVNKPKFQKSVL